MKREQHEPSQPEPQGWGSLYRYASIGLELGASVVGLTLAGVWFDYHFKTRPAGTLVGAGLGIVGGLYNFLRAAVRIGREARPPAGPPVKPEEDDRGRDA